MRTNMPGHAVARVEIRRYRADDLDRVIEIWRAASALAHPFQRESQLDRDEALIRSDYIAQTETWCARSGDGIAGFLSLIGARVVALFVDPAQHRRGIGGALIEHARDRYGPLWVEVFASNDIAMPFYRRHGFRYVRDDPNPGYPDEPQWLMAQALDSDDRDGVG